MTLDQLIREYCIEIGDVSMARYAQFYQFAISGLRELNMDTSGVPSVVALEINSVQQVTIPRDFIAYSRIALCGGDGRLHSLGLDNTLCLNQNVDSCGNPVSHTDSNSQTTGDEWLGWGSDGYADNFRNGECMGRFFGIGGGNNANGYFRIDTKNGIIQLNNTPENTTYIVMEYLSDISLADGDYEVHPYIYESLKAFIYWASVRRNKSISLGEKQLAEAAFNKEYRISNARFKGNTVKAWEEAFRTGNLGAPKF